MSVKKYCYCENNCKYETMSKEEILAAIAQAVATFSDNRLVAQGATALAINLPDEAVKQLLEKLPDNPTAQLLREEIAWRVE